MTIAPPPPAPLASSPPAPSGGGRTAIRVVLVAAAAVVVVGALTTLGVLALLLSSVRVVTDTQALPDDLRSLTIDTGDVPVALRITTDSAATEPRVDLRMVTSAAPDDGQRLAVTGDAADSGITLGGDAPDYLRWRRAGELEVVLPPDLARGLGVTVNQQTGLLSTDADLDQLVANTTNGAVTLGGSARRVEVQVRHGDISVRHPIAVTESFTANAENGDIRVEFRTAPRTAEAISGDGDVTVGLPGPDPYQVRAQSGGRHDETTVTVPETTDPNAPAVTARSENGDVTVTSLR